MLTNVYCSYQLKSLFFISYSFSGSLLDSSHGGSYRKDEGMTPLDKQHKLFGALRFPVTPETEDWKEKVSFIFKVCCECTVACKIQVLSHMLYSSL